MSFPSPPWSLRGQLWLSLFAWLPRPAGRSPRAGGLYGVACVDYQDGGVLTYRELLTARLVRDGAVPRVTITDIWVDSQPSRDGGRSLWAIPKDLGTFAVDEAAGRGAVKSSWEARQHGASVASARFTAVPAPVPRLPFRFSVAQTREDGGRVVTGVTGSARAVPAFARWDFTTGGRLGWLRGKVPVVSLRMADFRLTFGT